MELIPAAPLQGVTHLLSVSLYRLHRTFAKAIVIREQAKSLFPDFRERTKSLLKRHGGNPEA